MANIYSTNKNYQMSNFYFNLSFFLNNKFLPNKILLAENFYNQKNFELAKKAYESIKSIGKIYSWYASIHLAIILENAVDKKAATSYLVKEFRKIKSPNFENYYELANFFKDNKNYKKSIKYYSLALKNIEKDHQFGVTLEAGHVILPGSCTKAFDVNPGDQVIAEYDGLGKIGVGFS